MRKSVETKRGTVHLIGDMPHEELSSLQMEEGLGVFFHYRYEDAVKTREVLASVCTAPHDRLFCAVHQMAQDQRISLVKLAAPRESRPARAGLDRDQLAVAVDGARPPIDDVRIRRSVLRFEDRLL
jgi:hypothetical protein